MVSSSRWSQVEGKHILQAHSAWINVLLSPTSFFFLLTGSRAPWPLLSSLRRCGKCFKNMAPKLVVTQSRRFCWLVQKLFLEEDKSDFDGLQLTMNLTMRKVTTCYCANPDPFEFKSGSNRNYPGTTAPTDLFQAKGILLSKLGSVFLNERAIGSNWHF